MSSKHWAVTGYYPEDPETLMTVTYREFNDFPNPESEHFTDDDIYYYGMNEETIQECIKNKTDLGGEFIPISYEEI